MQALDESEALALGLGEVVARERVEQRPASVEVEREHLIGPTEVQVDRALVDGRVRPGGLYLAEELAGADVDQGKRVGR